MEAERPPPAPPRRFRVVLVRMPPGGARALRQVIPGHELHHADPPVVLRVTGEASSAAETARRLVAVGAGVVVQEEFGEDLHCPDHSAELVTGRCEVCQRATCSSCALEAGGPPVCRSCGTKRRDSIHWTRTRQLFLLLLFVLFLYQIARTWEADRRLTRETGPVPVAVLQFAGPRGSLHPMVRGLAGLDPAWAGPTLADVAALFSRERQRYTGSSADALNLSLRGPWDEIPAPPPLPDGEGLLRDAWRGWRQVHYWRRLADRHGVDRRAVPVQVHVIYRRSTDDVAAESRASIKHRLAIVHISLDDPNPAYPALTIAHELAHTLGATDRYDAEGYARYPEGYVEPFRDPLYPQRYAELMSGDVPWSRWEEREPRSLEEVRIGHRTAAELGWISHDRADAWYRSDDLDANDRLPPDAARTVPPEACPPGSDDPATAPAVPGTH